MASFLPLAAAGRQSYHFVAVNHIFAYSNSTFSQFFAVNYKNRLPWPQPMSLARRGPRPTL